MFMLNGKVTLIRLICQIFECNFILYRNIVYMQNRRKKKRGRDVFFKGGNKIPSWHKLRAKKV